VLGDFLDGQPAVSHQQHLERWEAVSHRGRRSPRLSRSGFRKQAGLLGSSLEGRILLDRPERRSRSGSRVHRQPEPPLLGPNLAPDEHAPGPLRQQLDRSGRAISVKSRAVFTSILDASAAWRSLATPCAGAATRGETRQTILVRERERVPTEVDSSASAASTKEACLFDRSRVPSRAPNDGACPKLRGLWRRHA
jgi:hypothetical protein